MKTTIVWSLMLAFLMMMVCTNVKAKEEKSFYKYPPSQVLQPASIWNPILTTKNGKVTQKSYFKYPASKTLQPGTIWNPLITEKKDK